ATLAVTASMAVLSSASLMTGANCLSCRVTWLMGGAEGSDRAGVGSPAPGRAGQPGQGGPLPPPPTGLAQMARPAPSFLPFAPVPYFRADAYTDHSVGPVHCTGRRAGRRRADPFRCPHRGDGPRGLHRCGPLERIAQPGGPGRAGRPGGGRVLPAALALPGPGD